MPSMLCGGLYSSKAASCHGAPRVTRGDSASYRRTGVAEMRGNIRPLVVAALNH